MSKYESIKGLIEEEIHERRIAATLWEQAGQSHDRIDRLARDWGEVYAARAKAAESRADILALRRRLVEMEPT